MSPSAHANAMLMQEAEWANALLPCAPARERWLLHACWEESLWSGIAPKWVLLLAGVWVTPGDKSQGCHRGGKKVDSPLSGTNSPLTPLPKYEFC